MEILSENFKVKDIMSNLMEAGKERKKYRSPEVTRQSDKALKMIEICKRKKIKTKRDYDRAREAFDQNYEKMNPTYKPKW